MMRQHVQGSELTPGAAVTVPILTVMLMHAHRPVALAHQNGRALRPSCPCAQAGHVRAYRPRAHTRMPAAYADRTYRSRRPAGALMRACRSRMCIPTAHVGRVHRLMCP